jgi:hypothetical protein
MGICSARTAEPVSPLSAADQAELGRRVDALLGRLKEYGVSVHAGRS